MADDFNSIHVGSATRGKNPHKQINFKLPNILCLGQFCYTYIYTQVYRNLYKKVYILYFFISMQFITIVHLLLLCQLVKSLENTFVIEFDRPIESFASKRHILGKRSIFYEQLNVYNISYDIRHEYDVINAVSIQFKTPHDSSLFFDKALGVKRAWPVVSRSIVVELF